MTSVSELIGLHKPSTATLTSHPNTNPDDYPDLAPAAKELGVDIRTAYAEALAKQEEDEREEDRHCTDFPLPPHSSIKVIELQQRREWERFAGIRGIDELTRHPLHCGVPLPAVLERAKEYVELNEQVETSTSLLTDLSSFLSTFQRDLSAVSGHISELQGRSKTIEGRLEARKAVERSLNPLLISISISPSLIRTINDTEVGLDWVPVIVELDAKLGAIRSGPRVEGRKRLDEVAEGLRIKAASKLLSHFLTLLRPFTLSISPSLSSLQSTSLTPLKPLFDFLRRHAARQAHEFQKAYLGTVRWYYETGFRRFVRGLEKIRVRGGGGERGEGGGGGGGGGEKGWAEIGNVNLSAAASLALLSKKNSKAPADTTIPTGTGTSSVLAYSQIDGPPVIQAFRANEKNFHATPEALFRSVSLVLMDNADTEHTFISSFFGHHSGIPILSSRSTSSSSSSNNNSNPQTPGNGSHNSSTIFTHSATASVISLSSTVDPTQSQLQQNQGQYYDRDRRGSVDGESVLGSETGRTSISGSFVKMDERGERLRKTVVDGLWKQVMEPAQEYVRNFASALLDPTSPPSPVALLTMIRLNESVISSLIDDAFCPPMENHLIGLRMQLWPAFAKVMNTQIESIRKVNGSIPAPSGVFAQAKAGVTTNAGNIKDSAVQVIVLRYTELFNSFVALSGEQDEEMVFSSLLRLRQELDKLLSNQAAKISQPEKQRAFLYTLYEELLQGLSAGLSMHARSQAEVAHYRELMRQYSS